MILLAVGTRPEAVKLAPVERALRALGAPVKVLRLSARDALFNQTARSLGLPVDFTPHINTGQGLPPVPRMLAQFEGILAEHNPRVLVVQGDTWAAFAGAVAAYNLGIPVAHIEAGLRSGNLNDPHPEEGNRRMITQVAETHFCPTEGNEAHVLQEIDWEENEGEAFVVGNPGLDQLVASLPDAPPPPLEGRYVLVTMHRGEAQRNDYAGVRAVERAVERVGVRAVWPLHPAVERARAVKGSDVVVPIPPLDYLAFLGALRGAAAVVTDSGGVVEEATFLGVPTVVAREATERWEAVEAGVAVLAGLDASRIEAALRERLAATVSPSKVFGDGEAAPRIAKVLRARYG